MLSTDDIIIHTYIITDGTYVKIGKSGNVAKRMKHLQCASSRKLNLLADIPFDIEKELHRTYRKCRTIGEWFYLNIEQLQDNPYVREYIINTNYINVVPDEYITPHKKCKKSFGRCQKFMLDKTTNGNGIDVSLVYSIDIIEAYNNMYLLLCQHIDDVGYIRVEEISTYLKKDIDLKLFVGMIINSMLLRHIEVTKHNKHSYINVDIGTYILIPSISWMEI